MNANKSDLTTEKIFLFRICLWMGFFLVYVLFYYLFQYKIMDWYRMVGVQPNIIINFVYQNFFLVSLILMMLFGAIIWLEFINRIFLQVGYIVILVITSLLFYWYYQAIIAATGVV